MRDVIYPYKRTPSDRELRYSLRSLANLPHGRVIISGDAPSFATPALTINRVPRYWDRYASSTQNIYSAAKVAETDEVVVMNDDIFILEPWEFRHEHRCTIAQYVAFGGAAGEYLARVKSTSDILQAMGVSDPLFFGLHTPTVYDRRKLIELIDEFVGAKYLLRTLYHNLFPAPSDRRDDVKIKEWKGNPEGDVISITDGISLEPDFVRWAEERFPTPSPYEAASALA